jgi:hypothetical protein
MKRKKTNSASNYGEFCRQYRCETNMCYESTIPEDPRYFYQDPHHKKKLTVQVKTPQMFLMFLNVLQEFLKIKIL